MKKTLLVTSLAVAMGVATSADAAFTALSAGDYRISITGGCFDFGDCVALASGGFTDNTAGEAIFTTNTLTVTTRAVGSSVGSGTVGGTNGTIDFTLDVAGNMTVTSYAQDSYLGTAGGTFYVDALGTSGTTAMGGTIDASGNVVFDPTGREGLAAGFATSLGTQPWNDSKKIGMYDQFTTGTSTNEAKGGTPSFTLTGTALQDSGVNAWSGTLVSTGNINGDNWVGFSNVQFSEVFNITVTKLGSVNNDDETGSPTTGKKIAIADLLSNDVNLSGSPTFNSIVTGPSGSGTVTLDGSGGLDYVPDNTLVNGNTDSFTYIIDGSATPATVTINITASAPPVVTADTPSTAEDTPLDYDPVANDTDTDMDILSLFNFADGFSANNGTVTATGNTVTYTPALNFNGNDTFYYRVADGSGNVEVGEVTVSVSAVNDAPVCSDVALSTGVDIPLSIVVANDLLLTTGGSPLCVDVEGDAVSLADFDDIGDKGGVLSSDGAGTLTYTSTAGFFGLEKFNFTAKDSLLTATSANVLSITAGALKSNFTMLEKAGNVFGGTNDVDFVWDEATFNTNDVNGNNVPTDDNFGVMTIASDWPFYQFTWTAHHVRVFKNDTSVEKQYQFDVTCLASDYDNGVVECNRPIVDQGAARQFLTMTLQPGEIGGHILFDWNEAKDIDVINVWKENEQWNTYGAVAPKNTLWLGATGVTPAADTLWGLVSTDVAGDGKDGINGSPMIDGPFRGYFANFNYKPAGAGQKLPPYTGNIGDVDVDAFSMGIWSLLAGLFSVFGLRRINNKK